jgi:Abortive infection alpha
MDELEKAALEAGAKAVLAPFTQVISDAIGAMGGDALQSYRERKQARRCKAMERTVDETRTILKNRGVEPDPDTAPEHLEEILEAAQDTSIPELRDLFARLAAAAADPSRKRGYRREFVGIVNKLEPIDALLLPKLADATDYAPNRVQYFAGVLQRTSEEIDSAMQNLARLGLISESTWSSSAPRTTSLGTQFLRVVQD